MGKATVRCRDRVSASNAFVISAVICLLASCTTMKDHKLYNGSQLPDDQTALLVNKGDFILIHSIDGIKNPIGEETYGPGRIEVLPGDHSLTISFCRISTSSELAGNYY